MRAFIPVLLLHLVPACALMQHLGSRLPRLRVATTARRLAGASDDDDDMAARIADDADESAKLLEAAARLRAEIAEAEGKSIEQVEAEAAGERARAEARAAQMAAERAEQAARREAEIKASPRLVLSVPATLDQMTTQAARAVERAHADGEHTRRCRSPLAYDSTIS